MQQLHLVGVTTDHDGLIFSTRRGTKSGGYVVPLDDALLSMVEEAVHARDDDGDPGDGPDHDATDGSDQTGGSPKRTELRRPPRPPRPESALTPREMQARLRSGRTVAQVAREARVDEEWVERFAAPIFAEQAQVVKRARSLVASKARLGASAQDVGTSVLWNLADRGIRLYDDEFDAGWTARHFRESTWLVEFRYESRKRKQAAEWELDLRDNVLAPRNRLASDLGFVETGRRRKKLAPLPERAAPAPVVAPKPTPAPVVAARPEPRKATVQKAATKKTATKKSATKRTAKKATAKKTATKKTVKKATAKKATSARASSRRAPAKRSTAKRSTAKRTTAKRTTAKRTTAKRTTAKRAPSGKAPRRTGGRKATPAKAPPAPQPTPLLGSGVAEAATAASTPPRVPPPPAERDISELGPPEWVTAATGAGEEGREAPRSNPPEEGDGQQDATTTARPLAVVTSTPVAEDAPDVVLLPRPGADGAPPLTIRADLAAATAAARARAAADDEGHSHRRRRIRPLRGR